MLYNVSIDKRKGDNIMKPFKEYEKLAKQELDGQVFSKDSYNKVLGKKIIQ
jgi:hypothetical protein